MKITPPNQSQGFKFQTREIEGENYTLVTPGRLKLARSDWADNELIFRSLVYRDSDHEVASVSFFKFFNWGESGKEDGSPSKEEAQLLDDLENNRPVWFTRKEDGSCVCRAVIGDKIHLRTRGILDANEHTELAYQIIQDKYPLLLDPEFLPQCTLIFELVSPSLRIILPYPEDDLIFIGLIRHTDLTYADVPELIAMADAYGWKMVPLHELSKDPDQLMEEISEFRDWEGIVVRANNGQTLTKAKGNFYLVLHRLKFSLSAKVLRALCIERDVKHITDFEEFLKEYEADWELMQGVKPMVETFIEARHQADDLYQWLDSEVQKRKDWERKNFAIQFALILDDGLTPAAFAILDERIDKAHNYILEHQLNKAFSSLEAQDDEIALD